MNEQATINWEKAEALRKAGRIEEARSVELEPSDRTLLEKRIAAMEMNAHDYMEKYNAAPPISMVPCHKCGVPSSTQDRSGGWCGHLACLKASVANTVKQISYREIS